MINATNATPMVQHTTAMQRGLRHRDGATSKAKETEGLAVNNNVNMHGMRKSNMQESRAIDARSKL